MFDYSTCTDDELERGMEQLHALEAAARHQRLLMAGEYARRAAWRRDGAASMAGWMAMRHGISKRAAREQMRVAEALTQLPAVDAGAAEGRLSWEKLCAVTRVATAQTDAVWAERAEKLSVVLLAREVARHVPPSDEQDTAEQRRRYVRGAHEPDGGYRLWARLDAAGGALVEKALMLGAERVPPDPCTGQPPAYETRCADALVGLARQSLSDERDPDRATIVVHVDGELASSGQVSGEIAGGPVISSATAQRLACDARWQYVARGPHGPIGIGRTSRIIPAGLARQVLHLYGGMCAYPGCETRIFIEIHHILQWLLGGRTDLTNLAPFCWSHHAVLHQPGWRLSRDPDGTLHFRRPDGRHLVTRPPGLNPHIRERMLGGGIDGEGNRGDPRQLE